MLVPLLLLVSGCGTFPGAQQPFPGNEPAAAIVVDNAVSGYVSMVVFISSTTGGSFRLGSVSSAGDNRFIFRDVRAGEYFLEGRLSGRTPLRSPTFLLGDGDTVEWSLTDNRISYR